MRKHPQKRANPAAFPHAISESPEPQGTGAARYLGDSQVGVTLDTYSDVSIDQQADAAAKIAALLGRADS